MTKQEAISELTRAAELCPTTPLAEPYKEHDDD